MLTSYLELLGLEKRLLNDFYEPTAYLRDPEHLDIARKLLSGTVILPGFCWGFTEFDYAQLGLL